MAKRRKRNYQYSTWEDAGDSILGKPAIRYRLNGKTAIMGLYGLIHYTQGDFITVRTWNFRETTAHLPNEAKKQPHKEKFFSVSKEDFLKWCEVLKVHKDMKSHLLYANHYFNYYPTRNLQKHGK